MKAPSEDWAGRKCGVALPLLKQALLPALKKYDYRVVNIWGGGNVIALALVSYLLQKSHKSRSHLALMCWRIGGSPIPVASHYLLRSCHLIWQAENREVLEIVRSKEDVLAAHHKVSGMNFIPGGYAIPAVVREARAQVESQLIVNAPAETDT